MGERFEMRFTGSGGQGVILASVIFAEAAVMSGLHTVQSQAYGPEARGGVSRAETVISREEIWFSKVVRPNFLLALTQTSLDKYSEVLAPNAAVMADETLTIPETLDKSRVIRLPILRVAREKIGREMTANIVAVGAVNAALGIFPKDVIREAVRRHIPAGTEDMNMRAVAEGEDMTAALDTSRFGQNVA